MMFIVRSGTQAVSIRFLLIDELSGRGMAGLTHDAQGLLIAFTRDGDDATGQILLQSKMGNTHTPGAFREIDSVLMPGLYELDLPDELLAEGAHRVCMAIQAPGAIQTIVHLDLVGYDPYDNYRLGLDCLSREARHEVIARAFREVVPEIVEEFRREM